MNRVRFRGCLSTATRVWVAVPLAVTKLSPRQRPVAKATGPKFPVPKLEHARKSFTRSLAVLTLLAVPLAGQARHTGRTGSLAVATTRAVWEPIAGYILQSAMDMPEEKYGFKPTPEVRSFGELIGHVAGSQYMFCAAATGDSARKEDDVEKAATTKAALIAALKASTAYCAKAYTITDAAGRTPLTMFGQKQNRFWALVMNASHDDEHYGNIVTYLRMNGIVPPSSRPAKP